MPGSKQQQGRIAASDGYGSANASPHSPMMRISTSAMVFGLLGFALLVELLGILFVNGGRFVYVLDDAYIHLALAEEIARGGYGVNPGEYSSPSSSILWPFLLVPFAQLRAGEYVPLLFDLVAVAGTAWVCMQIALIVFAELAEPLQRRAVAVSVAAMLFASNAIPIAFAGMETSWQICLATLNVLGLVIESRERRVPGWLWAVLIVAPLIRYEALAMTGLSFLYLIARGHVRGALAASAAVALLVFGFSVFLTALGLPPIPASMLAKTGTYLTHPDPLIVLKLFFLNTSRAPVLVLAVMALLLAGAALRNKASGERALAAWAAAAIAVQVVAGPEYKFRYIEYAIAAGFVALLYVYRDEARRFVSWTPGGKPLLVAGAALMLLWAQNATWLLRTPLGSNDIYIQQMQMHRFATGWWRAPVAVNDIGWVSYRNDRYVLDLAGLASPEALHARRSEGGGGEWMDRLARSRGVELAMIYDEWFTAIPSTWIRVGTLNFNKRTLMAGGSKVAVYATNAAAVARAAGLLADFRRSLPRGARVDLCPELRAASPVRIAPDAAMLAGGVRGC